MTSQLVPPNPGLPPNCVGYAYWLLGLGEDGFYLPETVWEHFNLVPSLAQAELVAAVRQMPDKEVLQIGHVVAYFPEEQGAIRHRPGTGASAIPDTLLGAMRKYGEAGFEMRFFKVKEY